MPTAKEVKSNPGSQIAVHCCSLHSASSPVCNPYLTDGGFRLRDFPALGPLRGWLTGDGAWLLDSNAFQRLTLNQPVNEALGETSSSASPGFLKQFWTQQEAWQIKQTKSRKVTHPNGPTLETAQPWVLCISPQLCELAISFRILETRIPI